MKEEFLKVVQGRIKELEERIDAKTHEKEKEFKKGNFNTAKLCEKDIVFCQTWLKFNERLESILMFGFVRSV